MENLNKIKKILRENAWVQESFKEHQDVASRLTHWKLYKDFDEWLEEALILNREVVAISNETSIDLCHPGYDWCIVDSLDEDFKSAKLHLEYGYGAWEVYNG